MERSEIEIKTTRNALKWLWKRKKHLSLKLYHMSDAETEAYYANLPDVDPGVTVLRFEDLEFPEAFKKKFEKEFAEFKKKTTTSH